ncbi:50S ribosomal protein L25 [Candidatus Saccharibacteria bacterium]|nr:50S ribosomal protein L25 [Candidatus Saccharibacteria bacterium]
MSEDKLNLQKRELTGKQTAELRKQGIIPSVVYGDAKTDPILTQSDYNATDKILRKVGYHSTLDLEIDGKTKSALVKIIDIDPVKRRIRNVEFQTVSANKAVEATAPIHIIDFESSDASKAHLTLSQVLEEISIKAKPADLPDALTIDGSKLATAEDHLTLADIKLPKGVEFTHKDLDLSQIVANVFDPAVEAANREAKAEADKSAEEARAAEAAAENNAQATGDEKAES